MTITTKLTFDEYLKLMYSIAYKNWRIRFFTFIGLLVITSSMAVLFTNQLKGFPYSSLVMGLGFVFFTPVSLYFQLKKNYQTNTALKEGVTYTFTQKNIDLKGEAFHSQFKWIHISKVVEQKEYFLLYQQNSTILIVSKKKLNKVEINQFRTLLKGISTLITKLMQ